jgi:hypothetical protein
MAPVTLLMGMIFLFPQEREPVWRDGDAGDLQEILERLVEEGADEETIEWLVRLHDHPLDLNRARPEDIMRIPGIREGDVEAIGFIRARLGDFQSLRDLLLLKDGERILEALRLFVTVSRRAGPSAQLRSRLEYHGEIPEGAVGEMSSWGPWRMLESCALRLPGEWNVGLLCEKDPGEKWRHGFFSGFIEREEWGPVDRLILGDYTVSSGGGLLIGLGRGLPWGSRGVSGATSGMRLSPYHASGECRYLRGVALRISQPVGVVAVRGTFFLSSLPRAATVREPGTFTSLTTDGLFRTEGEIRKRNTLRETLAGGGVDIATSWGFRCGLTVVHTGFNAVRMPADSRGFLGTRLTGVGGTVEFRGGPVILRGDIAWSGGGQALAMEMLVVEDRSWSFSFNYSRLSPDFFAPYAGPDITRGRLTNVEACGLVCRLERGQQFAASLWAHGMGRLWRTADEAFPGIDGELGCELSVRGTRWLRVRCRAVRRWDIMTAQIEGSGSLSSVAAGRRETSVLKGEVILTPTTGVHMRTGWEGSIASGGGGRESRTGFLVSQEAGCTLPGGVTVRGRVSVFDTDGTAARLYLAETDGTGFWWNSPHSGHGIAWWFTLRWQPVSWCRLTGAWGLEEQEIRGHWTAAARFWTLELALR